MCRIDAQARKEGLKLKERIDCIVIGTHPRRIQTRKFSGKILKDVL